jgi:hypothetical protein
MKSREATKTILRLPSLVDTTHLFFNILAHTVFLKLVTRLFTIIYLMILNEKIHTKEIPAVTAG